MLRHGLSMLMACCLPAFMFSCRIPDTPITENSAVGYIYDPKSVDAIAARFPQSPQQKALTDRYRTALAEPVCVVAWEPAYCTWQIFYATSRAAQRGRDGGLQYGSAWGRTLSLGTCRVSLPKMARGKSADAPVVAAGLAKLRPSGRDQSAAALENQVAVEQPVQTEDESYFASIRETVARAPEHDVLVFVHGFNVDFASAVARAAQVALDVPFNGAVVAYSWPSQGGVSNYGSDEKIIAKSVDPFVQFLDRLDRTLPADAKIHILVHSMGNRIVLNGLSRLPERFRNPARFANVVLAAPDVGVQDFLTVADKALSTARRTTLYVNGSDTALIASKAMHNEQRIGDAFPAVVVPGVETIDASTIETSFMGHSYYGSNRRALCDLFAVLKEDRPAAQRPWLRAETSEAGRWWVFASQPPEIRFAWYFENLAPKAASPETSPDGDARPRLFETAEKPQHARVN